MELRQLNYFVAVASALHFNRAAARMCIAQSALSAHIQALEKELGVRLLERSTRRVELTRAGEVFYDRAVRIIGDVGLSAEVARSVAGKAAQNCEPSSRSTSRRFHHRQGRAGSDGGTSRDWPQGSAKCSPSCACRQQGEGRAQEAEAAGLRVAIGYEDVFHQCSNAQPAVIALERAMDEEGISHDRGEGVLPMKGSEDFGLFGPVAPSAMFFLGAGENHARLHNPDYDFPDDLIGVGARVFMRAIRNELG